MSGIFFAREKLIQIQTTFPQELQAHAVGSALVQERLVACAQVLGPITSHYLWQGNMEKSSEWLCLLKTRAALFEEVCENIRASHPYDCPELIATPINSVADSYLRWVLEMTSKNG